MSLPFAKKVLKITPTVARRSGWDKENGSDSFYIKFRTEEGRNEVSLSQTCIEDGIL